MGTAAVAAAAVFGAAVLMMRRRYLSVLVRGLSMAPAFDDGDRVLVRRLRASGVHVGDVVVLRRSMLGAQQADSPAFLIKRTVAIAGDPVPPQAHAALDAGAVTVPAGTIVVLGDNPASEDSKQWGFVNMDALVGVVVGRHGRRRGR